MKTIICVLVAILCHVSFAYELGFEWKHEGERSPLRLSDEAKETLEKALKSTNVETKSVHRFDSYSYGLKPYFWAWHNGGCNGLFDYNWAGSNGGAFGDMVNSEVTRLRKFGVLKSGGVAIDIGAHTGDSTIPMALLADQTIAFDPSISTFPLLAANAAINPHLKISAYNLAVAPHDGELEMEYEPQYECNGGMPFDYPTHHRVMRKSVNLKNFLESNFGKDAVLNVAYIKIDTEGFDSSILASLYDLVEAARVKPIIQVEYFMPFMVKDIASQHGLSKDSLKLVEAIRGLPGNYGLFCSKQCNTMLHCNLDLREVQVRREGTVVRLWNTHLNENAQCDDFVLLPHMGSHRVHRE